jgi:hypothetical protein
MRCIGHCCLLLFSLSRNPQPRAEQHNASLPPPPETLVTLRFQLPVLGKVRHQLLDGQRRGGQGISRGGGGVGGNI